MVAALICVAKRSRTPWWRDHFQVSIRVSKNERRFEISVRAKVLLLFSVIHAIQNRIEYFGARIESSKIQRQQCVFAAPTVPTLK
jgi:hypothetical protein